MKKLTNFIVNKKNYIIVLFIALIAYCIWGMGQVKIEYDITSYLPSNTDTKQALDIMEEEFVTFGTTKIMLRNISFEDALVLHDEIEQLDGVKSFDFHNTEDYYKQSCALFNITFDGDADDELSVAAYNKTLEILDGYDLLVSASFDRLHMPKSLQHDVNFVSDTCDCNYYCRSCFYHEKLSGEITRIYSYVRRSGFTQYGNELLVGYYFVYIQFRLRNFTACACHRLCHYSLP